MELGVGYGRLRGNDLARPFHGVRSSTAADDLVARCRDYLPRMQPDEFFCSATAALLHGVLLPLELELDDALHVAVPNPRRARRAKGVVGHKFMVRPEQGEVVDIAGLRASSPERAWCELGALLDLRELVAAGDQIIRPANHLSSAGRLRFVLERHPARRGREQLHQAFALLDGGAESPPETYLRLEFVAAGLHGFRINYTVRIPWSGRRRRIDIAFLREKVAIEYQGDHHRDPRQWREDMTRAAELESLGWKVMFVNADDLRDPAALVARVRAVLASRA
jgi:very-short-patch-repair endonuclease